MSVPEDIAAAMGEYVVTNDGQGQARLIAYTDQPTVTIEYMDGSRASFVVGNFLASWKIPKPLTEDSKARAAAAVRRAGLARTLEDDAVLHLIVETMARELDDQAEELY